jgi:hypothetical protein
MKGGSYNGVKQSMNLELVCDTTAKEVDFHSSLSYLKKCSLELIESISTMLRC